MNARSMGWRIGLGSLAAALLGLGTAAWAHPRYEDLPERPRAPHDYFTLESRFVAIRPGSLSEPLRIHYKVAGQGPALLLIHGLMTDSYSFRYVIRELAKRYTVYVPDLPGAGLSDIRPGFSWAPASVAGFLAGFVRQLGIRAPTVVGNSLGGSYALWFAALYPEIPRRVVIMHSPVFDDVKFRLLSRVSRSGMAFGAFDAWVARNPEQFVIDFTPYLDSSIMSQEEAAHYAAVLKHAEGRRTLWRMMVDGLDPAAMTKLEDFLRASPQLPPLALFWAKRDPYIAPQTGPRLQALIPGSKLVWFEPTYHFIQVERPREMVAEILKLEGAANP